MKALYLLLGLLLVIMISSATSTPFLIGGWVIDSDGDQVNDPNVTITNLNRSEVYTAETIANSNYYQHVLDNISAGDVLEFNTTDGTRSNITKHDVVAEEIRNGTIFPFNITLAEAGLTPTPQIIGSDPDSPVHDIGNATRTFNITINQEVNVTWLINGLQTQTNESVTDASYTNTSADIGVWNVSARVSNGNGTAMQEWVWYVAPPSSATSQPAAPFVVCGWMNYEGGSGVYDNHTVNITNHNTGTVWQAETQAGYNYYELILDSGDVGASNVFEFEIADGVGYNTTNHTLTHNDLDKGGFFNLNLTLTVLAPLVDVELTQDDDPAMPGVQVINEISTTNRTVTITANVTDPDDYKNITDVIADITGADIIEESPVSLTFVSNSSATTAKYTGRFNMSDHTVGDYNVVVRATNTGGFAGTSSKSFTYLHETAAPLHLSPFIIYGSVSYDNGTFCNSPFVVVTNLNTSEELIADNRTGEGFYQLVTSSAFAEAGDVLRINASKNGIPVGNATHTVNRTNIIEQGVIEVNINLALVSKAPRIIGSTPESPVHDIENATQTFNITIDQVVNVTWLINGTKVSDKADVNESSYTNTSASIGVWNVSAIASNVNGTAMQVWVWNVTTLLPPNITSFTPPLPPVHDTENATQTFNITIDQVVDVTWLINGNEVFNKADVNESSYTNTSASIGVWNVTAVASNQNGTDAQEWIWHVTQQAPTLSSVFVVYGNVSYDNGGVCNSPFVIVTNLNTSEELIADNRTGESFYQLVTNSTFAKAGDVLKINASKNGMPIGNATLTVNRTDIGNGAIKVDINKRYLSDFTVTDISFNLPEPLLIGDLVTINATIVNSGAEGETFVEFYDNKSITVERSQNDNCKSPVNDTITFPNILRIRVHFESFDASSGGNITIHNKTRLAKVLSGAGTGYWTEWCDGDTIRIESWNAGFTVDRYEAVLANVSITLGEGNSTEVFAKWNISLQEMGWATNGTHNITARVDPYDQVIESNETNNEKTKAIGVNPSFDFAVTDVSLNPGKPVLGGAVEVSANITNYGVKNATTVVEVYYDNTSMEIERTVTGAGSNSTDIISLPPGVLGARLHLKHFNICNGEVAIYDGDGQMVERITHSGMDGVNSIQEEWTDWIYGENITIKIELLPTQYYILNYMFFSTNLTWEDELNNGTIPEGLKNQLESESWGFSLSDNATVEKKGEEEWIIIEGGTNKYCIRKESEYLNVYFYDYYKYEGSFWLDEYEALIAEEPVTLNATESKVINASWCTGAAYGGAGDHNITVTADPCNTIFETNETNNTLSEQVFVNGTDLTVTAIEIPCGDDCDNFCIVGQDVHVTATIANIGAADATNFTVEFKDDTSDDSGAYTSGVNFDNVHIPRLDSGESRNIPVIWNPNETTNIFSRTITASIPYDKYTDNNKTNNELFEYAWVEARYDFTVENVSVEQDDVRRGESVNITATIGSIGHAGENVSIVFFVNSTDYAGTCGERFIRIGMIDDVRVELNETETVSIAWDVDVAGGCHLVAAVVNPDNEVEELEAITPLGDVILFRGETGNNVKNCTLHVITPKLDITNITLVPAEPNIGDVVNVSAEIRNNGGTEANHTVWFYMEKDSSQSLILQPEDVLMRVHFDHIKVRSGGKVNASVTDSGGQDRSVHFYAKCEECGGQDMKVSMFDPVETGCYYEMADYYRHWDDVWTEWTNGTAIKINGYSDASISIDKYQVLLGNETVTLGPGESRVYHSTWNASVPTIPGEYYKGMVCVENRTKYSNETYLGGTDLTITNLSVKLAVYDGDKMWINATIENLGKMNATDFLVNFTEVYHHRSYGHPVSGKYIFRPHVPHLEWINTTHIEDLGAGNSINISVLWNMSIRDIECVGSYQHYTSPCPPWTEYECDDYNISIEIIPLENEKKEEGDTNHTRDPGVQVDKSRDFVITDISFRVNNESRNSSELVVYDDVTLNATLDITNLANQGGVVDVSFYIDEVLDKHKIGNTTVAFPAGNGTGYAQIEWNVDSFDDVDIIGRHNMTVVIDPDKLIYEIDELNNVAVHPINVKASDPEVEFLDIHPVSPKRNEPVRIEVTIANYGEVDADNVTLTIYDWAKRHIEDEDKQSGIEQEPIVITKDNATAMRLYLDLEVEGGSRVCVNDRSGKEIVCYHENFHGWTPWVLDNSTTIVVINNGTDAAYAKVSKIYYLESGSIIDTSTHDLGVNVTKRIAVNWTPPTVGERLIAAIIDPEDRITEHDEVNNRLVELMQVQTADLAVSNLSLAWHNGTVIGKNEIIKDGDDVRISANIANIGVEDAGSFDVRFLVDDLSIQNEVIEGLAPDGSICVSADWHVTVGDHLLKVEADYTNETNEMNETNNIAALERYVRGAELSGNTSWETLGLSGKILFGRDRPYDEDEVNITARITNSGYLDATDFNAALFFDYTSDDEFQKHDHHFIGGINRTYHGAEYVYVNVTTPVDLWGNHRNIIKDDVIIYDGNGSEVARPVAEPGKPYWVRVNGNTTNVSITTQDGGFRPVFDIYFYPIYQNGTSMLFEGIDVPVNSSRNLLMKRNVSAGDRTVMLIIDPENKVPEDEDYRKDNTVSRIMHVKPTRDFTVTNVTASHTNLSDLDTPDIIADVANFGLRNGTADVSFVDYEVEHRTYKYHFDPNRLPSYLPIPPGDDVKLKRYENLMIIHRPGVDAIDLHFDTIYLIKASMSGMGAMAIYDEKGNTIWSKSGGKYGWDCDNGCEEIPLVPGETAYIDTTDKASFNLDKYTTETEFHREEVRLNASKTCNESKNVTPIRTAYTGDHTIVVTLDGDDKITEMSESNNELSSLFHVNASRDPVILRINITPENPGDGGYVNITAVVANNGSENASFTVDLWANLTRNKPGPDESLPVANLTTNMGGGRIRYITLLNHTTVTLAPGKNTTVNATWNDISIAGNPIHHIIAIIDPTDEIDEMNESNNEIVKEIIPKYPDLTIGTTYVPEGVAETDVRISQLDDLTIGTAYVQEMEVLPVVPIKELGGASGASDVTVRFEAYETEECTKSVHGWDKCKISHPGAFNMQVYFDSLDSRKGSVIVNDRYSFKNFNKEYEGTMIAGVWSPWVEGDTVCIISRDGTTYAKIGEYRWGNVSDAEQFNLHAGGHEDVKIPWTGYREPYDLTITVDPDNNITELNEDNNKKTVLMHADLRADNIDFVSPSSDKLSLDAEKFKIDGIITNEDDKVGVIFPVSDFNVTLEFWNKYPNGTVGDLVFNMTKHIEDPIYAGKKMPILFEFNPSEELEVGGNYTVNLTVDSSGVICESNELYPDGEDNNAISVDIYVYNTSGYTGGGDLINIAQGEVNGRVVYTVGDNGSCELSDLIPTGGEKTVKYTGVVPDDADDIEFARIFVYWHMYHRDPNRPGYFITEIADVDVTFNGRSLSMKAGNYTDTPVATKKDYGYGLYSYDVTNYVIKGENIATVKNNAEWLMGVQAIGLLVIYEDEDEPLTKYWINEGADVMMPDNPNYQTGLSLGTATARFSDVEENDTENVDATLLTVLGFYNKHGKTRSDVLDALEFNNRSIGSLMCDGVKCGYWEYRYSDTGLGLTKNKWENVTDHLKRGDNLANIHSTGNYMMPNNAFLRLIFPPDLAVTDIDTPISAVVGNKYAINTTISNKGRSDATDFNVSFYSNKVRIGRQKISRLDSGDNITLQFNWKPMHMGKIYKIKVAADVVSGLDWIEPDTDNNEMTKKVPIVASGYGNESGPIGEGGNGTGGSGEGGEGVSLFDTITGILMKGSILDDGEGGGGGIGEFSLLEWLMKGLILAICSILVYFGYSMEKRRHNNR